MTRTAPLLAVLLVAGALTAADTRAASLVLNPNAPLAGAPGSTLGWGYTITTDPDRIILNYFDLGATIDGASGSVSFEVFDYPVVEPGTAATRDYHALARTGLLELTLAGDLQAGQLVSGVLFGTFFFDDETEQTFEVPFSAEAVAEPIPEPSTLMLIAGGLAGLLRRRTRARAGGAPEERRSSLPRL